MELAPYVAQLREQLALAAEPGGAEARALADRLSVALESAARLALLEVVAATAAEVTQEIAPGSVEVRLRGRDPELVVVLPPPTADLEPEPVPDEAAYPAADDAAMTRINLRLSQDLKDRVEDAARASGISVNAWLVRSAAAGLVRGAEPVPVSARTAARGSQHYSGWVR